MLPAIDCIHKNCALTILELKESEIKDSHVQQLFLRSEDGGFDLLPLSLIASLCVERRTNARNDYLQHLQLPTSIVISATTSSSIADAWRCSAYFSDVKQAQQKGHREFFKPWIKCRPLNCFLELDDDQFLFACRARLGLLKPFPYTCPLINKCLSTLPIDDFNHHIFACQHCAAPIWWSRHEMVVKAIKRVSKFNDIVTRIPENNEMPLVGNTKGGADLLAYLDHLWQIDVSIELSTRTAAFRRKINTYEESSSALTARTLPFIMNQFGIIDSRTEAVLSSEWKQRTGTRYLRDLLNVVQFELIKGQYHGFNVISARLTTKISGNSSKTKKLESTASTVGNQSSAPSNNVSNVRNVTDLSDEDVLSTCLNTSATADAEVCHQVALCTGPPSETNNQMGIGNCVVVGNFGHVPVTRSVVAPSLSTTQEVHSTIQSTSTQTTQQRKENGNEQQFKYCPHSR
jgi:hypothetical protein